MALGDPSSPVRFGGGQVGVDNRELFLKVFGGEVLAAFDEAVHTLDKHMVKSIEHGKSAQFPKTWKASSEYHTAGAELLGTDIDTTEVVITIDGLLVSHTAIYDLDEKMSHFDVTSEFSMELGRELARAYDKNVMRQVVLAARAAADGPFPGGTEIVDAALLGAGAVDGKAWIDHIIEANEAMFANDVPEELPRYCIVSKATFNAIKYAQDSNGQYLLVDRDFGTLSVSNREQTLNVDGVTVWASKRKPNTDESGDTSVYSKYRADYSTTTGIMWCPPAVGTLKLIDVNMETERDVRRQEDFMVAKMAVGHGTLRPECAIEFKTA